MTTVVFYEKPGCLGNAKQKQLLAHRGHCLHVRNLLSEPWTAERLRRFFGERPVRQWLNPSAPRVKSGEIDPAALDEPTALALMLADPLLIRRPLLETEFGRCAGFEPGPVLDALGMHIAAGEDLQSCLREQVGGSASASAPTCDDLARSARA
jgi:nitrogenase-associated protein